MKIFHAVHDFVSKSPTVITIGTFDGVHIGHRKILERLKKESVSGESTILTFYPHPRKLLNGADTITLLNTIEERIHLLQDLGIDNLIIQPFNSVFAATDARVFVRDLLVNNLKMRKIIIGHDHRFGVNRAAGISELIDFSKQYHYEVVQIPAQEIDEVTVSSTKIRQALLAGNLAMANSYLGYQYLITGKVVHGKQLGRELGYPTANVEVADHEKLIPAPGVYAVWSFINNVKIFGMMNIGYRPTIGGATRSIETHFFDFNADLYQKSITLHLVKRIRNEQAFTSLDGLKKQLLLDEAICRNMFQNSDL
jgi:riboflavin kinase/FMN adenylyltransferase